jgi:hypothetical protein
MFRNIVVDAALPRLQRLLVDERSAILLVQLYALSSPSVNFGFGVLIHAQLAASRIKLLILSILLPKPVRVSIQVRVLCS